MNYARTSIAIAAMLFTTTLSSAAEPKLKWFGHAAFQFSNRNGRIFLIDPWITNPKAPKNVSFTRVDAILLTHAHQDHVGEAFDLAAKHNATIVASYELTEIAKKKGVKNVQPLNPSGSAKIDNVVITAVPAVHSSGFTDGDAILYGGQALGFILQEEGGGTIYHAGDTGVFSDMSLIAELYHPQVALLPIGGVFVMKPPEAAIAVRMLQVKTIVPMHFGTFPALTGTPSALAVEQKRLGVPTAIREMKPGEEIAVQQLL
jgi:L-ascorbate metabolism protein UlaG (beta-lactamase superfamily)